MDVLLTLRPCLSVRKDNYSLMSNNKVVVFKQVFPLFPKAICSIILREELSDFFFFKPKDKSWTLGWLTSRGRRGSALGIHTSLNIHSQPAPLPIPIPGSIAMSESEIYWDSLGQHGVNCILLCTCSKLQLPAVFFII